MELFLVAGASLAVAAFAKLYRNRSLIFWSLGTFAAFLIGEIPIRLILADSASSPLAKTLTVVIVIGGTALLLAVGSSRKPATPPAAGNSSPAR